VNPFCVVMGIPHLLAQQVRQSPSRPSDRTEFVESAAREN